MAVVAAAAMLAAGCGSQPVTGKVAAAAKREFRARQASCSRAGLIVLGEATTLYSCRLAGVPPAYRPVLAIAARSFTRCYVVVDGAAVDVSRQAAALEQARRRRGLPALGWGCPIPAA
jgi:hypothetical protein